jgi:hypothetical protein
MKRLLKNISTIVLICIMAFGFSQCGDKKKKQSKPAPNTTRTELKPVQYSFENPPKFRKDGELSFIDNNTDRVLFHIDIEIASDDGEKARFLMFRPEMD